MVELDNNVRMVMLTLLAVILVFELLNIPGMLGGGDKLFLMDLIGIGDLDAFRPDTGLSEQDYAAFAGIAALGAGYFLTAEDELDWEALLGDDDEEE
tara:strand:- start:565 stop:855 length:291 start_codon:yes stop_codon:yes gene_type:complete